MIAASRYRTVDRTLPVGLAPERGLQVKTILASRAITAAFPEIRSIGGVRPDALRWHPNGLALDVMIPNPGTAEGIALGNEIVYYVLRNAPRFGMQDAIWRGVYYTPNGGATRRRLRPLRPRSRHHDRRRIPHRQRVLLPLRRIRQGRKVTPPSTLIVWAVMKLPSSESSRVPSAATSSGLPNRDLII